MNEHDDASLGDIQEIFERQLPMALKLRTSTAQDRRTKLVRLRDGLLGRREAFYAAFDKDLRKPLVEVNLTEVLPVVDEIRHTLAHLANWMRPRRVSATLTTLGTKAKVLYQPRGRCLIIGPWNYPVNTLLGPLVSAVAAGNTVILKPSEMTPHVNAVIAELIAEVFDPTEVAVVQGGIPTSTHLLALPFDHIFFTGSPAVGKVVMAAAAKHLTSVTLELGGKSPVVVDESADLALAAELIVWGKLINAGQSCVAPDYVLVHTSVKDRFVDLCKATLAKRYGRGAQALAASPDLGRMINSRHAARVGALIDEARAGGACAQSGGNHDAAARYVAPTLLTDVPVEARIRREEIFGPVLPIETFDSLEEAIDRINADPKPLAMYVWSRSQAAIDRLVHATSSGGVCVNHCMQQYAHTGLPFGGVNNSGMGNSHGIYGFKAFSHERAWLKSGAFMSLKAFFPPYSRKKVRWSNGLLWMLQRF